MIVGYNANESIHDEEGANEVRTGSHNLVIGDEHTYSSYGGIVAGLNNMSTARHASVTGGEDNEATGELSSVSGGRKNEATAIYTSVTGGVLNKAQASGASVSGGADNLASEEGASISGGANNQAQGVNSWVGGGDDNSAVGDASTVSGGSIGWNELGAAAFRLRIARVYRARVGVVARDGGVLALRTVCPPRGLLTASPACRRGRPRRLGTPSGERTAPPVGLLLRLTVRAPDRASRARETA